METFKPLIVTKGSYQSTITLINDGCGGESYRVKVTFNNGDNVDTLKEYSSLKTAKTKASRALTRLSTPTK